MKDKGFEDILNGLDREMYKVFGRDLLQWLNDNRDSTSFGARLQYPTGIFLLIMATHVMYFNLDDESWELFKTSYRKVIDLYFDRAFEAVESVRREAKNVSVH